MEKFYFTFGSDPGFPYQNGYLVIIADNQKEAVAHFRSHYPDRTADCLNCAFVYDEDEWLGSKQERIYGEPIKTLIVSKVTKKMIKRITTEQFMNCLYDMARADGVLGDSFLYEGNEIFVDYASARNFERMDPIISNYEWDLRATPTFGGSEGIYLDISLYGYYYEGQDTKGEEKVGTVKTLSCDKENFESFGRLGGNLTWHARELANGMLGRLSPSEEIEKDCRRQEEKGKNKYFFCMEEQQNHLTHEKGYVLCYSSSLDQAQKWIERSVYSCCEGKFLSEGESNAFPWLDYVSTR